ncbi:MAG: HAD-IB family hydrolase [Candidatus Bathyarchaeota archaeon]|nr:HAD-IB family hydrolase [Candidatus Bathyarchaeota archaeon]
MRRQPRKGMSCAFFDIDGTLVKGFMIQSFPRYLADAGFVNAAHPDQIDEIILNYHSGRTTYREAAETVPYLYAFALKAKDEDSVKSWAGKFMQSYLAEHLFSYSEKLVRSVRGLVDVTIALSGSPHEVVQEIRVLGFDRVYGSRFEVTSGVYTGRVLTNLILGEEKAKLARKLSEELSIDLERSIAFGDTDQDESLLDIVGLPVGLNPTNRLKMICESRGWEWLAKTDLDDIDNVIEWLGKRIETGSIRQNSSPKM